MLPTSRLNCEEHGFVLPMAVVLLALGTLLIGVMVAMATHGGTEAQRRAQRSTGLAATDSALATYTFALRTKLASEFDGFALDRHDMELLASSIGGTVVDNGRLPFEPGLRTVDASVPPAARVAMRMPHAGSPTGAAPSHDYWQVARIEPPLSAGNLADPESLVVYLRGWVGTGDRSGATRTIRAAFQRGSFANYQLLANGEIVLHLGDSIEGSIHSNGNALDFAPPAPGVSIWADGDVNCLNSAMTVSRGVIAPDLVRRCYQAGAGSTAQVATVPVIGLDRIGSFLTTASSRCGATGIVCLEPTGRDGQRMIHLDGDIVTVDGRGTYRVTSGTPMVLLIRGDATIDGETSGRLTVAIAHRSGNPVASTLFIDGNVGAEDGGDGALGLVAEGNIVVNTPDDPDGGDADCPVEHIHAALASQSGSLTIDPRMVARAASFDDLPHCDSIEITGSVAGHRAPGLYFHDRSSTLRRSTDWEEHGDAGYARRTYRRDRSLEISPPPMFPTTDDWDVEEWKDANLDCLSHYAGEQRCA